MSGMSQIEGLPTLPYVGSSATSPNKEVVEEFINVIMDEYNFYEKLMLKVSEEENKLRNLSPMPERVIEVIKDKNNIQTVIQTAMERTIQKIRKMEEFLTIEELKSYIAWSKNPQNPLIESLYGERTIRIKNKILEMYLNDFSEELEKISSFEKLAKDFITQHLSKYKVVDFTLLASEIYRKIKLENLPKDGCSDLLSREEKIQNLVKEIVESIWEETMKNAIQRLHSLFSHEELVSYMSYKSLHKKPQEPLMESLIQKIISCREQILDEFYKDFSNRVNEWVK